jgi:hypothetical protein
MTAPLDISSGQGKVVTTVKLNIRKEKPNTRSAVVRTVPPGTELEYKGWTDVGEPINGISRWYQDVNDHFFWSGGVKIKSISPVFSSLGNRGRPSLAAAAAPLSPAGPISGGNSLLQKATMAMLDLLDDSLPPPITSLPEPGVSLVRLEEKAVGIGNRRGIETRKPFHVAELKGIRLDARVRFQLWATSITEVGTAITDLNHRLMAGRDLLWTQGLLRLQLEAVSPADFMDSLNAWRQYADYQILYEYRYQDSDGADSLISRIPIAGDLEVRGSPEREMTVVTDEMVRWDNESAPALAVRGRLDIGSIACLAFVPGTFPTGTVTLTRTFDGATGSPTAHPDLAAFLASVAGDAVPERHGQVRFASLGDFLNAFGGFGDPVSLGDWDMNGALDNYQAKMLAVAPVIHLPNVSDRFEIAFQNAAFDTVAVVYLRIIRG